MSWGLFPSPVLRSVGLGHRFRGSIYEPKMHRKKLLVSVRWKHQTQDLEASLLNESFCFCELHVIEIGEEGEEFWRIEERGSRGKPSDVGWREGDDMMFLGSTKEPWVGGLSCPSCHQWSAYHPWVSGSKWQMSGPWRFCLISFPVPVIAHCWLLATVSLWG